MNNLLQYWEFFLGLLTFGSGLLIGNKRRKIQDKKEEAIAEQEEIKIKKEEVELSGLIKGVYEGIISTISTRLEILEKANNDLTKKYDEILLRNGILEERAETYEKKYKALEKDHIKLNTDYQKIQVELEELKNDKDTKNNK